MSKYSMHFKLLLQKLFIYLLAVFISISAIYLLSPTLQVHASEGGVNGGMGLGTAYTSGHYPGGASENKTGIFIYFASKNDGTPLTGGFLMVRDASGESCDDKSGLMIKNDFGKLAVVCKDTDTNLPAPVLTKDNNWRTNGYKVKEYLEKRCKVNGEEMPYYLALANKGSFGNQYYGVKNIIEGKSVYDCLMEDSEDVVLVVMPVTWMNFYLDGKYYNYTFIGTGTGWTKKYADLGYPRGDTKSMSIMTNRFLPASMVLQEEKWGLEPRDRFPVPKQGQELTYNDVNKAGWDMFIIELPHTDTDDQTTCDEPEQPKPHPAPNESTGTTTIIKNYRTVDKTGKMVSDDGCFKTDNVSNRIDIEDEDTYKVVGFKISTTVQDNIPSETWETVVPAVTRQGDKPETVELTTPEACLYVLLEKSDDNINTWDRPLNDIPEKKRVK